MSWNRLKSLQERLSNLQPTNDNLHRIAISNLRDHERTVIRWWCKKYQTPVKPLEDHTIEELTIEMLEDYYEARPEEIERFFDSLKMEAGELDWDGRMPDEYEKAMKKKLDRLNKKRGVNLEKYQSDEQLTDEEVRDLLANVGKSLPKSKTLTKKGSEPPVLGDEFDDTF